MRSARPQNGTVLMQYMTRRALLPAAGLVFLPTQSLAQMSQRARQIRERRACELDQADCRPEIRVQLEAERRRLRLGLAVLAVGSIFMGLVFWRRHRALQQDRRADLKKLHSHLNKVGGDSDQDQAKSDP